MRTRSVGLIVLLALAMALPGMAQNAGKVAEIHINRPKPGMTTQYEAGRKKHMAWHKGQKDTWSWYVWEVLTGEGTGSYVVGTFQHQWKDFDGREKFDKADTADAMASMGSSLAGEQMSYYIYRDDLSSGPEVLTPTPLLSITHYILKPDGVNDFVEGVKKIREGAMKTSYPMAGANHVYQLANGGDAPHFVIVGDRANWAAFAPPSDKSLDAMMEEAYGKEQGAAILATARKAIRSIMTGALQYRPDLSYVAGK
jgi:hypothetical protein